jgi:hypothetical protein
MNALLARTRRPRVGALLGLGTLILIASLGCGSSTSVQANLADLTLSSNAHAFLDQSCPKEGPSAGCGGYKLYVAEVDLTLENPRSGTHVLEFEFKSTAPGFHKVDLEAKRFDGNCSLREVESLDSVNKTTSPAFSKRTLFLDKVEGVPSPIGGLEVQRVVGSFEIERTDGTYLRGSFDAVPGMRRETTACDHTVN